MQNRPLILVSNDDGIEANGVHELVDRLLSYGDVVCVCPDGPRSGQSMAITFNSPLRLTRLADWHGAKMYMVNGTPVDCVKIAMDTILDRKPDLMVSGINHGSNAAINVVYSGTMGAAFEACACGVAAIGFSLTTHRSDADFSECFPFVDRIVGKVLERGLPEGVCLNVNIPAGKHPQEFRIVSAAKGKWTEEYRRYEDPEGRPFYWLTGKFENDEPENEDTDEWCLRHGIVSVVACELDRTCRTRGAFSWLSE